MSGLEMNKLEEAVVIVASTVLFLVVVVLVLVPLSILACVVYVPLYWTYERFKRLKAND